MEFAAIDPKFQQAEEWHRRARENLLQGGYTVFFVYDGRSEEGRELEEIAPKVSGPENAFLANIDDRIKIMGLNLDLVRMLTVWHAIELSYGPVDKESRVVLINDESLGLSQEDAELLMADLSAWLLAGKG